MEGGIFQYVGPITAVINTLITFSKEKGKFILGNT